MKKCLLLVAILILGTIAANARVNYLIQFPDRNADVGVIVV